MTTQFLSRVEREVREDSQPQVGPGAYYNPGSGLSKSLPGFAPFSTSSRRKGASDSAPSTPAPGTYNISGDPLKTTGISSAFKSNERRFKADAKNPEPGPGDYVLQPTIGKSFKKFTKPVNNPMALIASMKEPIPPSIPAKSQSNGYEILADGRVKPQDPLIPSYSGNVADSVGPADYHPKVDFKFKHTSAANFSKSSDQRSLDKLLAKASTAPGPGYYDTPSSFDLSLIGPGSHDADFLVHLHNAKRKQTSSFESRTDRDSLMKEIRARKELPGPGEYVLPADIKKQTKPAKLQFFASSDERFKDPISRSNQITVAPGSYNPITSEFDQMKMKILKQKKMSSRSEWTYNIAFASTDGRFKDGIYDNEVPPASAYLPKTTIADQVKTENPRSGPFGSTEQRFRQPKPASAYTSREKMVEQELNRELQQFMNRPNAMDNPMRESKTTPGKPKYSSSFAPTPDTRLRPVKTPPGPAPGSYDTNPKWTSGAPVMAPSMIVSKKKHDPQPGPGQYVIDSGMGSNSRNPKNIMLSTTKREEKVPINAPGPGRYNLGTSMIRPSHNILLSDKYR